MAILLFLRKHWKVIALVTIAAAMGAKLNGIRYKSLINELNDEHNKIVEGWWTEVNNAKDLAAKLTKDNLAETNKIDTTHYKDFENAPKTIENIRIGLRTNSTSLCKSKGGTLTQHNSDTSTSSSVDDGRWSDQGRSGETVNEDILELGRMALLAIAQRDGLREKSKLDTDTINSINTTSEENK